MKHDCRRTYSTEYDIDFAYITVVSLGSIQARDLTASLLKYGMESIYKATPYLLLIW